MHNYSPFFKDVHAEQWPNFPLNSGLRKVLCFHAKLFKTSLSIELYGTCFWRKLQCQRNLSFRSFCNYVGIRVCLNCYRVYELIITYITLHALLCDFCNSSIYFFITFLETKKWIFNLFSLQSESRKRYNLRLLLCCWCV